MREKLKTAHGRTRCALRKPRIEPVFGQINATGASTGSCEEAEPPCTRSYVWWQRPTTSSSSTPLDRQHRLTRPGPRLPTDTSRCCAEHRPRQESRSFRIFRWPGGQAHIRQRRRAGNATFTCAAEGGHPLGVDPALRELADFRTGARARTVSVRVPRRRDRPFGRPRNRPFGGLTVATQVKYNLNCIAAYGPAGSEYYGKAPSRHTRKGS
jgi:hypothetical protein